jgi:hypothetical protein
MVPRRCSGTSSLPSRCDPAHDAAAQDQDSARIVGENPACGEGELVVLARTSHNKR